MASKFSDWEVDPLFSAAEEVQDSADRLESAYRAWLHAKFTASGNEDMTIELFKREVGTALGTSKWQLEEFESAASRLTWNSAGHTDNGSSKRHMQFIDAIQRQIFVIEEAFQTLNDTRDLKALPIVRLEHEERDDLALFLSGSATVRNHTEGDNMQGLVEKNTEYSSASLGSLQSKCGLSKSSCSSSSSYVLSQPKPNTNSQAMGVEKPGKHCSNFDQTEIDLFVNGSTEHLTNENVGSSNPWIGHRSISEAANVINDEHVLDIMGVCDEQEMDTCFGRWDCCSCMKTNPRQIKMSKSGFKRWKDGDAGSRACTDFSLYCTRMQGRWNIEQAREGVWLRGMHAFLLRYVAEGSLSHRSRLFLIVQHSLSHEGLIKKACGILLILGLIGLVSFFLTSSLA